MTEASVNPAETSIYPALQRAIEHILSGTTPLNYPVWARLVMDHHARELQELVSKDFPKSRKMMHRAVLTWAITDLAARVEGGNPHAVEEARLRLNHAASSFHALMTLLSNGSAAPDPQDLYCLLQPISGEVDAALDELNHVPTH